MRVKRNENMEKFRKRFVIRLSLSNMYISEGYFIHEKYIFNNIYFSFFFFSFFLVNIYVAVGFVLNEQNGGTTQNKLHSHLPQIRALRYTDEYKKRVCVIFKCR